MLKLTFCFNIITGNHVISNTVCCDASLLQ